MKIILASGSPQRAKLLKQLGVSFRIDPSSADESIENNQTPEQIVKGLSLMKATDVASRHAGSFLIAADTIVVLGDEILGKPDDKKQAKRMLRRLSGRTHSVFTGVRLLKIASDGKIMDKCTFCEKTLVTFSTLTDFEIDRYIARTKPYDKAGSYGIQDDLGCLFVERIEGDYYNVVGFPVNQFYRQLKNFEPDLSASIFEVDGHKNLNSFTENEI
ncbi:MAG: Maf family protein [Balneolaceae bacterium]